MVIQAQFHPWLLQINYKRSFDGKRRWKNFETVRNQKKMLENFIHKMGKKHLLSVHVNVHRVKKITPSKKTQQIRKEQNYPQLSAKLRKIK